MEPPPDAPLVPAGLRVRLNDRRPKLLEIDDES